MKVSLIADYSAQRPENMYSIVEHLRQALPQPYLSQTPQNPLFVVFTVFFGGNVKIIVIDIIGANAMICKVPKGNRDSQVNQ